jgi:histone deacetylase complex regulatory component SIN3
MTVTTDMAVTTRSDGRVTRLRRDNSDPAAQLNPPSEGQNDPPPPPQVPPPGDVEQNQTAALEAQIAFFDTIECGAAAQNPQTISL